METITITRDEQKFIVAYLEAVNFTDTGDTGQPEAGTELDADFMRESAIDCLAFYSRIQCYLPSGRLEDAARDFWFTRQGHGVGFWDGDWPKYGDMFTRMSKAFGEAYPVFEELATC